MFDIVQFVVLGAFLASAYAQIPISKCPDVEVVNDFDASKYVGRWYENQVYPTIFELNAKCTTATYTAMPDGSVGVFNENIDSITGEYKSINGSATFDGPSNVGKLIVQFPNTPAATKGTYWVLGTDYDNYAVVWSCNQYAGINIAFSWILTREAFPAQSVLENALEVIEKNNVPTDYYVKTNQKDCDRKL